MGRRGPPKTPRAVLKRRGSWRAKLNKAEPQPTGVAEVKDCPAWMDKRAKDKWKSIAPRLIAMGLAYKIDVGALARYCQLWSRWREAEEYLQRNGPIQDTAAGGKMIHPYARIASTLAEQLTRLEDRFGLTPSARRNIEVKEPTVNANDRKSRFFAG